MDGVGCDVLVEEEVREGMASKPMHCPPKPCK
jgi:hypothetical protein